MGVDINNYNTWNSDVHDIEVLLSVWMCDINHLCKMYIIIWNCLLQKNIDIFLLWFRPLYLH